MFVTGFPPMRGFRCWFFGAGFALFSRFRVFCFLIYFFPFCGYEYIVVGRDRGETCHSRIIRKSNTLDKRTNPERARYRRGVLWRAIVGKCGFEIFFAKSAAYRMLHASPTGFFSLGSSTYQSRVAETFGIVDIRIRQSETIELEVLNREIFLFHGHALKMSSPQLSTSL